jgi:plasmid stabilization system protein ParE
MEQEFRLRYLPLFEQDVAEVKEYITAKLHNPIAAERLVEETEKVIQQRLSAPLSFKAYNSKRDRKHPYYRIYVKNWTVFYVVIGDVMEIRRFLYSRRDISKLI